MTTTTEFTPVTASLVSDENRLDFCPTFFGESLMMRGERLVFAYMDRLSSDYDGGYWYFYELSNGGYYMAPAIDSEMQIEVVGNWFSASMSADAAGIVATLFALGQLAAESESDRLIDCYYKLREFALDHAEAGLILGAID